MSNKIHNTVNALNTKGVATDGTKEPTDRTVASRSAITTDYYRRNFTDGRVTKIQSIAGVTRVASDRNRKSVASRRAYKNNIIEKTQRTKNLEARLAELEAAVVVLQGKHN
jgi:hypothetical protein